ncbi:hypothetical protein FQA39_LY17448 [Lamprigera yunnana]|nr:hypothetical protein FQA39_LY17448 [Lamprigera yunnana]
MWMLYAEQHWTKTIDLKSAVERLYEKLGVLGFDADHEAIYGTERHYTVQQCEELRDKYKIGRKVCRKFLKGKTCSQCLVKRMSEIGLRHFLDTINKYIKDCSDSDTSSSSSDEEEFKAVEQNVMWPLYSSPVWDNATHLNTTIEYTVQLLSSLKFDADLESAHYNSIFNPKHYIELSNLYKKGMRMCETFMRGRCNGWLVVRYLNLLGLKTIGKEISMYLNPDDEKNDFMTIHQ